MEHKQEDLLQTLLRENVGDIDVMSVDFKPIDQNTTIERLDFQNVRGSVRLVNKRIKTPADVDALRQSFIELKIP